MKPVWAIAINRQLNRRFESFRLAKSGKVEARSLSFFAYVVAGAGELTPH